MALRNDLHTWLSAQPLWQQDLAKRLIAHPQLDGDEYDETLRMVKAAFGALGEGESAPAPQTVALDDLPADAATGAPRLVGFGRLRGVGAVSSEHELRLAPTGLTVIYGQNAVGKTTFVRALKRVCRTVDRDTEVRGNVFVPGTTGAPTATVDLIHSGQQHAQQLDLSNPEDLGLGAISVFDAECAELYVDARNRVAFVPAALRVLARLAATQDKMRGDLDREANTLGRETPSFPEIAQDTAVRRFLGSLSATTNHDDVRAHATLDEAQLARLAELRAVVASAEARNAHADAEAARQDARQAEALATQLRDLELRVDVPARERLRAAAEQSASADAALELARQDFSELPVNGVGAGPWRHLWQAARDFAEQASAPFPPAGGAVCPLCLQEVSPEAALRLAHFEEHVRSSVQESASRARQALKAELDSLDRRHIDASRTPFLAGLAERETELHAALDRYLTAVSGRMEALVADAAGAMASPVGTEPLDQLDEWGKRRSAHAETLLAADDPDQEKLLRAELAELDAREKLAARLAYVEKRVGTLGRIAALRDAYSALATNRITTKQRQLSEETVTGALAATLTAELRNLDCEHIPVQLDPETRVGETNVALQLVGTQDTLKVSDIASEGEQRALSLSFFLAEVGMSEGDGGIIVDDPVSSLDDQRCDYIAKRLVAETAHRQVIVFTHDLPFMLDLVDRTEKGDVQLLIQGIWRLGSEVGLVDDHPPFKVMKLRQRMGVLNQVVAQWDNQPPPADFDDAWRRACGFYARLRTTWERAVEERLFKGVVTRFQREIKTKALDDVDITPEKVALVNDGMTRCSMFVHDEPPGASTTLPNRARLAQDLEKLREFEKLTK